MSLTVDALRKLQQTGAFPTPAKGEGDDAAKKETADAKSEQGKDQSPPQDRDVEPTDKDLQPADATPVDSQLEMEPPVSTEPERERPETPVENDLAVPSNDQVSADATEPQRPTLPERSPKSLTERLESSASSRPGGPAPPERDDAAVDSNLTMPIPPDGFKPEPEEDAPDINAPSDDPTPTAQKSRSEPEEVAKPEADVPMLDPTMTMPMPPRTPDPAIEEPAAEPPVVDPTKTMPLPPSEAKPNVAGPAAKKDLTPPPRDASITQPLSKEHQPATGPLGTEPTAERDVKTPPTPSSHANSMPTEDDDQVLQTDIESLQAMVSEAVDESPAPTSHRDLRADGGRASSTSSGKTERLEGPGFGETIPEPITTETYRLFYDPVIPVVDLDGTDPTQTMELKNIPTPTPPMTSGPTERSGTEPFDDPAKPSDRAESSTPANATIPDTGRQQQSVVIPTAYERELIEHMSEKEFEKHFQNLHNQLGARSNHQMVGSYLFVSPTQTPRTADVTANLALLLEKHEREVLLVDANLEQQTLTRRLEALSQSGLCDIISGTTQPNDVVLPTSLKRLRFVPSGDDVTGISRIPNRVDMHAIRQLLSAWCDDRRTIICDVGSIDASLAVPMAQAFDAVILVVSMIDVNIDAVHAASRVLTEHQVRNLLGCVVTDS